MKKYIMLIGLPASGKSTYLNEILVEYPDAAVISRDHFVEEKARELNLTYDQVFKEHAEEIDEKFKKYVQQVRELQPDIVVNDKTNLTNKGRDKEVQHFKDSGYEVTYIFFEKPERDVDHYVWKQRLSSRKGKFIPDSVIEDMLKRYEDNVNGRITPDYMFRIKSWGK